MTYELLTPSNEELSHAELESQRFLETLTDAGSIPTLAAAFEVEMPAEYHEYNATQKLAWLQGFSEEFLGTRKGKERQEADAVEYSPAQETAIMQLVHELHMEGESYAKEESYDGAVVLGARADEILPDGTRKTGAMSLRVAKLHDEMERGIVAPYIFLLGSSRKLVKAEREADPAAETEFDAITLAFERQFGIDASDPNVVQNYSDFNHMSSDKEAWKIRHYDLDGMQVFALSAPLRAGSNRANTTDTNWFLQQLSDGMLNGGKLLNVTTDLYVPFQHADALRMIGLPSESNPAGTQIETIGYGGAWRPADKYAAEILAAVNKGVKLDAVMHPQN